MPRFLLNFTGGGPAPAGDLARVAAEGRAKVVDDSLPWMVLVEGPEAPLRSAVARSGRWTMSPERMYRPPPPHPAAGPPTEPG